MKRKSTIVEIIEAYQPRIKRVIKVKSTIVEIIEAYQPVLHDVIDETHLQQQKLLKHTSLLSIAKIQKIL